ncbi:Membrane protein [Acidilobus saccharovorans 345-15]|uniref:Membrane protein n=2 Tax=Acidilobus TaxID=105850 RepID=D9Q0N8_ACIS3|nr:Membrane protein [Acidilobus saccharovorans 345-15]
MAMAYSELEPLLMSVAVGAIVGLVNEYRKITGSRIFLGLRTSIFTSMLGYVFALLYEKAGYLLLGVAFISITVIAATIYVERARATRSLGATTYVSMFLVFASGILVGMGMYLQGTVISVLVAVLSFYKTQLLNAISRIRREELLALLNLLVISLVILPLLPDKFIGPLGIFNPYEFWFTVVVVAIIFFAQYVTLRVSKRGLLAFTIIGGLISSTTVTLSLIQLSNERREASRSLALNTLLSNVPLALIQVLAAIYFTTYSAQLAAIVAVPTMLIALVLTLLGAIKFKELSPTNIEPPSTPLPILRIVEFAVLLFIITSVAKAIGVLFPSLLPITIFVSALGNALGAVIAVGILYNRSIITLKVAAQLALLSLTAGVIEKAFLSLLSSSWSYRRLVIAGSAALGAFTAVLMYLLGVA